MKKHFITFVTVTVLSVALLAALFFGSVLWLTKPASDIVVEKVSPDGKLVAVVEEMNGDATTSFAYNVYLDQKPAWPFSLGHSPVALFDAATRSKTASGVDVDWIKNDELRVQYFTAKEVFRPKTLVRCGNKLIHVEFRSGIQNSTAPPGGMLYNLRGRPHDKVSAGSSGQ